MVSHGIHVKPRPGDLNQGFVRFFWPPCATGGYVWPSSLSSLTSPAFQFVVGFHLSSSNVDVGAPLSNECLSSGKKEGEGLNFCICVGRSSQMAGEIAIKQTRHQSPASLQILCWKWRLPQQCPHMVGVCPITTQMSDGKTIGKEDELPAACQFLVLEGLLVSSSFGRKAKQIILASQVCLCVSVNVFYRHSAMYRVTACH